MPQATHFAPATTPTRNLTAADAIWIATARLHARHPDAPGFTPAAIQNEVFDLHLTRALSRTVYQHIVQHVTATQPANPNRRRMLTDLGDGLRRLFIAGDDFHPSRKDSQIIPKPTHLPLDLHPLLAWYGIWSRSHTVKPAAPLAAPPAAPSVDPLLALVGTWTYGSAGEYLRDIRDGWEGRP